MMAYIRKSSQRRYQPGEAVSIMALTRRQTLELRTIPKKGANLGARSDSAMIDLLCKCVDVGRLDGNRQSIVERLRGCEVAK